jgi:hypothetical protein
MKHIIYKTTHVNGKYYIGRHSTDNIDDGYIGSGLWPRSIKDKSTLTREILEEANTEDELIKLEERYLSEHYGKPNCMNMNAASTGAPVGDQNPMKRPEIAAKISGDNHWVNQHPERRQELVDTQNRLVANGTHNLAGDSNPQHKPENKKATGKRTTERNLTNNPIHGSKHPWLHGKSPNANGESNKKLVEAGTHNFLGPEHNRRMIAEGKNPWVGSSANEKMLAAGTHPSQQKKTCEHCGKETSTAMHKRWHGEKCKQR